MSKRKAFNFYRSYWDTGQEIIDVKERLNFYEAIFLKEFENMETELTGISKFAYISQRHSIESQVKGYIDSCNALKIKAFEYAYQPPITPPPTGGITPPMIPPPEEEKGEEEVKEKEEVKEQEKEKEEVINLKNAEINSAVIDENILIEDEVIETETISFEEPKTEKKEKKGSAEKKESPFMNQCKQIFLDYYENNGQKYIWKPMDDRALGGVISQLKKSLTNDKNEQPSADRVIDLLKALLTKLPDWYKQNANSVSNINSSYNNIINQIKNERTKNKSVASTASDIMAKYYKP